MTLTYFLSPDKVEEEMKWITHPDNKNLRLEDGIPTGVSFDESTVYFRLFSSISCEISPSNIKPGHLSALVDESIRNRKIIHVEGGWSEDVNAFKVTHLEYRNKKYD